MNNSIFFQFSADTFSDIVDMIQRVCAAVNAFVVNILLFCDAFSACLRFNSHSLTSGTKWLLFPVSPPPEL